MEVDFKPIEYCRQLKAQLPPYNCPYIGCTKFYKTTCGLQYHLLNFTHPPPGEEVTVNGLCGKDPSRYVQVEVDNKICDLDITEELPIISQQEYDSVNPKKTVKIRGKPPSVSFPEAKFSILDCYNIRDAPPKPVGYVRYTETSEDDIVEYDLDEEDMAWLVIMNKERESKGLEPVSADSFELLMDKFEKECYFQSQSIDEGKVIMDDEAVCCICLDGECSNTNVILFCDMCNLAVHQDCYGVPYIPDGQWICRRCLHSPSKIVDCILCPNTGGAFKQTDRGHWAHIVCAQWLPEVRFANPVFLEPIDSIELIPDARWKLPCLICKKRGAGACVQCSQPNCTYSFHVTCGLHEGLYMKANRIRNEPTGNLAYCLSHTPAGVPKPFSKYPRPHLNTTTIFVPTLPLNRIQDFAKLVDFQKKNTFILRLIAYWTLKRQSRNGVGLLPHRPDRRLAPTTKDSDTDPGELGLWHRFRQDLERSRLLCELIRKRERLKKELILVKIRCWELQLYPEVCIFRRILDALISKCKEEPKLVDLMKRANSFKYSTLDELKADFEDVLGTSKELREIAQEQFTEAEREIQKLHVPESSD